MTRQMIDRRTFMAGLVGLMAGGSAGRRLLAQLPGSGSKPIPLTVYKSSSCGCCTKWVDYIRAAGFDPTVFDEEDMESMKDRLGVPRQVRSCHTAVIDKYLIEGHVPAPDIRRLLAQKPKLFGIAVPEMPPGTPGMAPPGAPIAGFEVVAFRLDGTTSTFAKY
jgi:hypothetical protein